MEALWGALRVAIALTIVSIGVVGVILFPDIKNFTKIEPNVDITLDLLSRRELSLPDKPRYMRVCVIAFQDSLSGWYRKSMQNYHSNITIDTLSPDVDVYWAILSIDDSAQTVDVKLVQVGLIKSADRSVCSSRLMIRVVKSGTERAAQIDESTTY